MSNLTEPRYTGHSGTGVDLDVPLEDGQTVPYHVEQGGYLPLEMRGVKVQRSFIKSLLQQEDAWQARQPQKTNDKPADSAGKE